MLEIQAKRRTGSDNFVSAMRKTVAGRYGAEPVGMGGVFQIKSGRAKLHVMVCVCEPVNIGMQYIIGQHPRQWISI